MNKEKNRIILKVCILLLSIMLLLMTNIYLNTQKVIIPFKVSKNINLKALKEENENYFNSDYWEWHTRTTNNDKAYNGNHIVINDNRSIDFFGYGVTSYKDYLYKQYSNAGQKIFRFKIDETKANYHTLDGAGFMFNTKKENNILSGYVLLIRQKDISIYRLDNVDTTKFEIMSNTTMESYGKLLKKVNKTSSSMHNLILKVSPTNVSVIDNEIEILNLDLDYSKHSGEDFGLIASYLQHDCSKLSKIRFLEFKIEFKDYEIPVLKMDEDKNPLEGAKFQVKNEDGEIIRNGITNSKGIYIIKGLKEGIYTLEEIEAPAKHALKNSIITFKVTKDGKVLDVNTDEEITLNVINEKLKFTITVLDKDNKTPIINSTVSMYDKDGNKISSKTDKDGKVIFSNIESGKYKYKQTTTQNGYIIDEAEYEVLVQKDGTVVFTNEIKGIIYNKKQEEQKEDKVENIEKEEQIEDIAPGTLPQTGENTEVIKAITIMLTIISIYITVKIKKEL